MLTPEEQTRASRAHWWSPEVIADIEAEAERMERVDGTEPDRWWLWKVALAITAVSLAVLLLTVLS